MTDALERQLSMLLGATFLFVAWVAGLFHTVMPAAWIGFAVGLLWRDGVAWSRIRTFIRGRRPATEQLHWKQAWDRAFLGATLIQALVGLGLLVSLVLARPTLIYANHMWMSVVGMRVVPNLSIDLALLPAQLGLLGSWSFAFAAIARRQTELALPALRPAALAIVGDRVEAEAAVVGRELRLSMPVPALEGLPHDADEADLYHDWSSNLRYADPHSDALLAPWRARGIRLSDGALSLGLDIVQPDLPEQLDALEQCRAALFEHWEGRARLDIEGLVASHARSLPAARRAAALSRALRNAEDTPRLLRTWAEQVDGTTRYSALARLDDATQHAVCGRIAASRTEAPRERIRCGLLAGGETDPEIWWREGDTHALEALTAEVQDDRTVGDELVAWLEQRTPPAWSALALTVLIRSGSAWFAHGERLAVRLAWHLCEEGSGRDLVWLRQLTDIEGEIGEHLDLAVASIVARAGEGGGISLAAGMTAGAISEAQADEGAISSVAEPA